MPDHNKYQNGRFSSNGNRPDAATEKKGTSIEDEINLRQLSVVMWRRKWLILGSVVLCGLLAGIIAFTSTPIYQSEGSILIYQSQSNLSSLASGSGELSKLVSDNYGIGLGTSVNNELEVLRSRKLSLNITDSLRKVRLMPGGRQYPVIFRSYPDDSTIASRDTVVSRLQDKLSFNKAQSGADVITVSYESPSAVAAGRVVNIALSQFNKLSSLQKKSSANSTATFLKKERSRIRDSLNIAENALRRFMNHHKLVQVDAQTQQLIQQMADLEGRRQQARAKLVAARSGIKQYQNELNRIKPGLAEQYSKAVGPDISKLQYAKSEREIQKQQLLANNPQLSDSSPQIAKLNQQIGSYKKRIKKITQNLINQNDQYLDFLGGGNGGLAQSISDINQTLIELQVQQKQYQSQVDVITSQLNSQKRFFNNLPDNIIDLAKLKRDVNINEELFETISKQYAETSIQERSQFGLGRIIDSGYTPQKPDKPNTPLYILFGLIIGAGLSAGYIFIDVAFFDTIKSAESMKKLPVPLLAVIPAAGDSTGEQNEGEDAVKIGNKSISKSLITFLSPDSLVAESYRQLENNLIYGHEDLSLKSIALTSSSEDEGKTTIVANLGVILAEGGHDVIIVDADFRRPNLHALFGLPNVPGIAEVLSGDLRVEDAIQPSAAPGLSLLATGERPDNVAATTKNNSFLHLLKNLETRFDFVLIDTAPFGVVADTAQMLKQADGVAVAAKFGKTSGVQLARTYEKLDHVNINVVGTILTGYEHSKSNDSYTVVDSQAGPYYDNKKYKEKV